MTHPNPTTTRSNQTRSDQRLAAGHGSSPKNDAERAGSEREVERAKEELAFLEENHSEVRAEDLNAYYARLAALTLTIEQHQLNPA